MRVGIIDADLIGRKKHRFPNLACMKISSWNKKLGHDVELLLEYDHIENYDKIFISKVFTDTEIPEGILNLSWVKHGGTGFYYDKAKPLPYEIEHCMPDYHLYDNWVENCVQNAKNEWVDKGNELEGFNETGYRKQFTYYTDYSIGFVTRGCIRGCSFCVNKNYRQCLRHSPVSEFLDSDRKYICLLDDNVLSCRDWKEIFSELNATGKRFQFKQGMDERLLTDEKCEIIFNSNWIGEFIFAFDNIKDKRIIEKKLKLIRSHTHKIPKFYCFCGYNHEQPDTYSSDFWVKDIEDLFERIRILMAHQALPYIMRYKDYKQSKYHGMYTTISRWVNQPWYVKSISFREYCQRSLDYGQASPMRYLIEFEKDHPDIVKKYCDMKWSDFDVVL